MTSRRIGAEDSDVPRAARLAYLVAQVPAVHHAYLLSEITALRGQGFDVKVASINSPDRPPDALTPEEADETRNAFYVKASGPFAAAAAHLWTLMRYPARYIAALAFALRMGRGSFRKTLYGFFYFTEAIIVGRWMTRHALEHVHVHHATNVGLLLSRIFPVTVSFTFHGSAEFYDPEGTFLAEKIRRSLFSRAISFYGRSQLMRVSEPRDWEKLEVAPLGVDTALFAPPAARPSAPPVEILCVGRLSAEKGHPVLIAAFERVVRSGRNARLRLVGDGPYRPALERQVSELGLSGYVLFEGALNQPELRRVYAEAHVMVLPSFAEGIPVVLMEAMATQLPCIASQITGIPELIEHGSSGLLVTASHEEQLAAAMICLIDSPATRERLAIAARERILRHFDVHTNAARLADIFRRRLSTGAAAAELAEAVARF